MNYRPFQPSGSTQKVTAPSGSSSAATSLGTFKPGGYDKQQRIAVGAGDVYIAYGDSSVSATTSGMLLKAGSIEIFTVPDAVTHFAVRGVTASDVTITNGTGL